MTSSRVIVELNHVVRAGMITYPDLPAPVITPHLTRDQSPSVFAPGTEFAMDLITMIGNTPAPTWIPHTTDSPAARIWPVSLSPASLICNQGATLVGIDSINLDDVADGTRPAHTLLLRAGIPVVEHLTALDELPARGTRFTTVPARVADFGTFPVRAFATVDRRRIEGELTSTHGES